MTSAGILRNKLFLHTTHKKALSALPAKSYCETFAILNFLLLVFVHSLSRRNTEKLLTSLVRNISTGIFLWHPKHTKTKTHLNRSNLTIQLRQHTLSSCSFYVKWWKCTMLRVGEKMCAEFIFGWRERRIAKTTSRGEWRRREKFVLNSPHHFGVCFFSVLGRAGAAAARHRRDDKYLRRRYPHIKMI